MAKTETVNTVTLTGAAKVASAYAPPAEVTELLRSHGIQVYPPNSSVGGREITWQGRQYVLPAEPTQVGLMDAAAALTAKAQEEASIIQVSELVDAMPWDGAQAFTKAVEDMFGWGITRDRTEQGFFGEVKVPPVLRSIKTGPGINDVIQVFWGAVEIPQAGITLQTGIQVKDNSRLVFCVAGKIPKGKRHIVDQLLALTRIYSVSKSIYRNNAIRMFVDSDGELDWERDPEFISIKPGLVDELIFTENTRHQINTNLFTPIRYPQACREMGIPLKRGILLGGPYGTGKSMTAAATASLAVENGWTFIMINRVAGLQAVLNFAHKYAPVVVFAEDIDRVMSGEERTVSIDDILNTLDGVQGKSHEVITVLTSNHVDKINKAMMRPGRLDAIITVELPDAEAAEKLIRLYGRDLITADTPLDKSRVALTGQIPAVIREAVERAKLSAIGRLGDKPTELTDSDLCIAAETLKTHLELMSPGAPTTTVAETLGKSMIEGLRQSLHESTIDTKVDRIVQRLDA